MELNIRSFFTLFQSNVGNELSENSLKKSDYIRYIRIVLHRWAIILSGIIRKEQPS